MVGLAHRDEAQKCEQKDATAKCGHLENLLHGCHIWNSFFQMSPKQVQQACQTRLAYGRTGSEHLKPGF